VLDALVIEWLGQAAGVWLRAGYSDDYARYVDLLSSWGAARHLAPAQVEEQIFGLIRAGGA